MMVGSAFSINLYHVPNDYEIFEAKEEAKGLITRYGVGIAKLYLSVEH